MRTKEQIESDMHRGNMNAYALMIELLLDVRELTQELVAFNVVQANLAVTALENERDVQLKVASGIGQS